MHPIKKLLLIALALVPTIAFTQSTGGLRVRVLDDLGAPRVGASVVLTHDSGRLAPQQATTDRRGEVEFPVLVAEGQWTVSVVDGERRIEQPVGVKLGRVGVAVLRFVADPEAPPSTIETLARDPETAGAVTRFPEAFIRDLPIPGRFYQRVLPLAPGVNDADGDGNPRVHGSTSRDFRTMVNGVANVDPFTNLFMSFVNSDSIDQLAVISSGAGLEYGRAQGGFATITQKIGGNAFALSAELRYRTSDLDSGTSRPTGDVDYTSVQPSVMLSGPIVQDKLWYRLAWERLNQEIPVDILTRLAVQERERTLQAYQVTWQASARNRLALQYQSDPFEFQGFGIDSATQPDASQRIDIDSETLSLKWTVPQSSRLLLETTVALQERTTSFAPESAFVTGDCVATTAIERSLCTATSGEASIEDGQIMDGDSERLSVAFRGVWHTGSLAGMGNQLRFGMTIENDSTGRTLTRPPQSSLAQFSSIRGLLTSRISVEETNEATADGTNVALYVDDHFRPVRNLVIGFGLRVDREELDFEGYTAFDPAAELEAVSNSDAINPLRENYTAYDNARALAQGIADSTGTRPEIILGYVSPIFLSADFWPMRRIPQGVALTNTNVSPRLAITWDPTANGRNKITAGARRYYGTIPHATMFVEQDPAVTEATFDVRRVFGGEWTLTGLPQDPITEVSVRAVDHDLKTPYQDEWRLGYERELWQENRLRLEYVNRKYRDQFRSEEINRATGDLGRCVMNSFSTLITSPGSGFELVDPYTGETYVDTDPGDGDGVIDDCTGAREPVPFGVVGRPDGRADAYVQNPVWTDVRRVGNGGSRDYQAFVLDFVRRLSRGWSMQASWVWSEFEGNGETFEPYLLRDRARLEHRNGFDSSDQRHVVKIAGTGVLRSDWHFGGVVTWQSGLPYSNVVTTEELTNLPPVLRGFGTAPIDSHVRYTSEERNSERNESHLLVDLRVAKGLTFGDRTRLELAVDVFNLLDDRPLQIYNADTGIGLVVDGVRVGRRQFGRSLQLGLRIAY